MFLTQKNSVLFDKTEQWIEDNPVRPYQLTRLYDVLKFNAKRFIRIAAGLSGMEIVANMMEKSGGNPDESIADSTKQSLRHKLPKLENDCNAVGLRLSCLALSAMLDSVDELTYRQLGRKAAELNSRIEDELSLCLLLQIPIENQKYYDTTNPFGDKVADNFPIAAYDIEEAAKCLALERSTACVMHLMRTVEAAIDAIAMGVGVHETAVKSITTWEHLLKEINGKIQANSAAKLPTWLESKPFYEGTLSHLHSVKDAWRNPAIHELERKYTEPEADRIYTAIKHLFEHLAEHLDEKGKFTR